MKNKDIKPIHFFNTHWYHIVVTTLITINAAFVLASILFPVIIHSSLANIIKQCIYFFPYIFVAETILRLCILKKNYFSDHMNLFSFAVLGASFIFKAPELTVLLLFHFYRSLRIVGSKKTRHVIDTLFHTIPGVLNLLFLICIAYFAFAVLGTYLFGAKVPHLWGTIGQSLLSLQQAMLGDDWGNNLRDTLKFYPYAWIFSTAFLIIMTFILLNVFIGVIVDAMQTAEQGEDKEEGDEGLKKEMVSLRNDIHALKKILQSSDLKARDPTAKKR